MRRIKTITIIVLLTISVGVLKSHTAGSLWPWTPAAVGVVALIVLFGSRTITDWDAYYAGVVLALVVVLSVFFRVYTFLYPVSLIGIDPDSYAVMITQLLEAGSIEAINAGFYSKAPLYHLLSGTFSLITGLPVAQAMVVYGICAGVISPLVAYLLVDYTMSRNAVRPALAASLIAAVATTLLQYSYWPIAQTLAAVFWFVFVLGVVRYVAMPSIRHQFAPLLGILVFSLALTHKLPLFPVVLFLGGLAVVSLLSTKNGRFFDITSIHGLWTLLALSFVMLFFQWTFMTTYISSIAVKITTILFGASLKISPSLGDPFAAVAPYPGLLGILLRRTHAFVLLPISALAWVVVFLRRETVAESVVLVVSAILFALFPLAVFAPDTLRPVRVLLLSEPIFAVIIGIALNKVTELRTQTSLSHALSAAAVGVVVIVLIAQLVVTGATPDHSGSPRLYLTGEEVAGKEFGYRYLNQSSAAAFYASKSPHPERMVTDVGTINEKRATQYEPLTVELYNATLLEACPQSVLYRPNIDIYRLDGPLRLTWKPIPRLDRHYDRVYANGGAIHYTEPQCVLLNTS